MKKVHAFLLAGGLMFSAQAMADSKDPAMLSHTCAGCHGTYGASAGNGMPVIGGQPKVFLLQAMNNYKEDKRHSTIMQRLAKGYDAEQLDAIAEFFSRQSWVSADVKTHSKRVEQGKKLHTSKGCAGCHGSTGIAPAPNTPRLAGQYPDYLFLQMKYYLNPDVTIPSNAQVMRGMLKGASDDDLEALAEFYASHK